MGKEEKYPLKKILMICSKGNLEDVYATLVMANGAVMEGIETKLFFTFFGLDAITKKTMNKLHTLRSAILPCECRVDCLFPRC